MLSHLSIRVRLLLASTVVQVVMLTLLPALLVIFGRWFFWPKRPAFGSVEPTQSGLWARMGDRINVRPRAVWVVTAVVLGIACLGLFKLSPSGLTTEEIAYILDHSDAAGFAMPEMHRLGQLVLGHRGKLRKVEAELLGDGAAEHGRQSEAS